MPSHAHARDGTFCTKVVAALVIVRAEQLVVVVVADVAVCRWSARLLDPGRYPAISYASWASRTSWHLVARNSTKPGHRGHRGSGTRLSHEVSHASLMAAREVWWWWRPV